MKKKILALLLTGILGVSMLAGCGAEEEAAPAAEAAEATEEAAEEALMKDIERGLKSG